MLYLFIKAAISGAIVAAVSEIARRYPGWGGLVASLPLTSLLAMIWLFRDTHDAGRVAELSISTIWFIIPSVPLFIALPLLIKKMPLPERRLIGDMSDIQKVLKGLEIVTP